LDRSSSTISYLVLDLSDKVPSQVLRLGAREDSCHSPDWIEVASPRVGVVSSLVVPFLGLGIEPYSQVQALLLVYSVLLDLLDQCRNVGDVQSWCHMSIVRKSAGQVNSHRQGNVFGLVIDSFRVQLELSLQEMEGAVRFVASLASLFIDPKTAVEVHGVLDLLSEELD